MCTYVRAAYLCCRAHVSSPTWLVVIGGDVQAKQYVEVIRPAAMKKISVSYPALQARENWPQDEGARARI